MCEADTIRVTRLDAGAGGRLQSAEIRAGCGQHPISNTPPLPDNTHVCVPLVKDFLRECAPVFHGLSCGELWPHSPLVKTTRLSGTGLNIRERFSKSNTKAPATFHPCDNYVNLCVFLCVCLPVCV